MKSKEEILEETMRCTIEEDADLDNPENFYFRYKDVLKAMDEYAQQFSTGKISNFKLKTDKQ